MKRRILHLATAVLAAPFAAGILLSAPAHADPPSGTSNTVDMPMPDAGQSSGAYQPPPVSMAVQDGTGGVDRDGTNGTIDPDGTTGRITGPLMAATPAIRAEPAPMSPRVPSARA